MIEVAPPTLYSYRCLSAHLSRERETILENSIWFSTPAGLNDPFEAKPHFNWTSTGPSRKELMRQAAKLMPGLSRGERIGMVKEQKKKFENPAHRAEYRREIEDAFLEHFASTSIKCFAESDRDIRMWSYYGGGHGGICLGFNFDGWTFEVVRGMVRTVVALAPLKVHYDQNYPSIDPEVNLDNREGAVQFAEKSLLTKAAEWKPEKEWRCFRPTLPSGLQEIPKTALRQIVLGAKLEGVRRAQVLALIEEREHPVEVFQASLGKGRYEIVVERIG